MRIAISLLILLFVVTGLAFAQSGGDPEMQWNTVDGGGVTFSIGDGYRLGGTIGQFNAGAHTGGVYTLNGGYWRCQTATAPTDVAISIASSTDATLTWTAGGIYDVWQGTSPYFSPGDADSTRIGENVTPDMTLNNILGNTASQYSFLVLTANGCGVSGPSNRTGEFDFAVVPGS